jgi:hypothetical protein
MEFWEVMNSNGTKTENQNSYMAFMKCKAVLVINKQNYLDFITNSSKKMKRKQSNL